MLICGFLPVPSGVAPANQTKERAKTKSSWISPIFVNSGVLPWENKRDSHRTFVPVCPREKFMNWPFFWFGLPGWLLIPALFRGFLRTLYGFLRQSAPPKCCIFWEKARINEYLHLGMVCPLRFVPFSEPLLDGQNRQSPIATVQRTGSTLACHSAVPRGANVKRMSANRAIWIAAQRTQGLWGLIPMLLREIWPPANASDSNSSDNSR